MNCWSAGVGQECEPCEGVCDLVGPGPVGRDAEDAAQGQVAQAGRAGGPDAVFGP